MSVAVDGYQKARLYAEGGRVQGDGHFALWFHTKFLIFFGQGRANDPFVHFYWYHNLYQGWKKQMAPGLAANKVSVFC
jgi:hypothetical protein